MCFFLSIYLPKVTGIALEKYRALHGACQIARTHIL